MAATPSPAVLRLRPDRGRRLDPTPRLRLPLRRAGVGQSPRIRLPDGDRFHHRCPATLTAVSGSWSLSVPCIRESRAAPRPSPSTHPSAPNRRSRSSSPPSRPPNESGLVFDYHSSTNYKFLAIDSHDRPGHPGPRDILRPRHRCRRHRDASTPPSNYILAVTMNGSTATAYLNNASINLSHAYSDTLSAGQMGLYSNSSTGKFTDFAITGTDTSVKPSGAAVAIASAATPAVPITPATPSAAPTPATIPPTPFSPAPTRRHRVQHAHKLRLPLATSAPVPASTPSPPPRPAPT